MSKMVLKGMCYAVQGTGAFLITGCTISSTFTQQVDSHLISPWRNLHYVFTDLNHFFMPEDLCKFKTELKNGMCDFACYTGSGFTKPK
jgi:hypothetical protein